MENPFAHNRATNIIGQVLDAQARAVLKAKENPNDVEAMHFASLEYRIMHALLDAGCLTEQAQELVGLEGRDCGKEFETSA
jgi:hypothetical protein